MYIYGSFLCTRLLSHTRRPLKKHAANGCRHVVRSKKKRTANGCSHFSNIRKTRTQGFHIFKKPKSTLHIMAEVMNLTREQITEIMCLDTGGLDLELKDAFAPILTNPVNFSEKDKQDISAVIEFCEEHAAFYLNGLVPKQIDWTKPDPTSDVLDAFAICRALAFRLLRASKRCPKESPSRVLAEKIWVSVSTAFLELFCAHVPIAEDQLVAISLLAQTREREAELLFCPDIMAPVWEARPEKKPEGDRDAVIDRNIRDYGKALDVYAILRACHMRKESVFPKKTTPRDQDDEPLQQSKARKVAESD